MIDYMLVVLLSIPIIWYFSLLRYDRSSELDLKGRFKPKRHFFFEKCSVCGKRLKHYHWFWGRGDFMACDVDYDGSTEWFCKDCDDERSKNAIHEVPHD